MNNSDSIGKMMAAKLDILIRLTAYNIVKGMEFQDQVAQLSKIGLKPKEIASVLGKTENNVNVTLSRIRKKRVKKTL